MSKPTVDKMVSENGARFKRKVEMFDLKSKSQMTSAEIRSELLKMSEACKETRGWFSPVSAEASSKLLARLSSPSSSSFCSVAEAAELLMQGADVSARDGLGLSCRSPLHWAAQHDAAPLLSFLLDFGASPDVADSTRTLPLHVAAAGSGSGAALLATLLLEAVGAGPAPQLAQNCAGWTPLHIAAFMGNGAVARLLLSLKGDDFGLGDAEGATPLHVAVGAGQMDIVRLLVSRGASVNSRATSGDTPLHVAARTNNAAIAALLVRAGADPSLPNAAGILASPPKVAAPDEEGPLRLEIGAGVPEARPHHFIVEEKAVEAVAGTVVSFVLRTSPPRLGIRFVAECRSGFGAAVTHGWTTDFQNGSYAITYRHPASEKVEIVVGLVEGGQVVARRSFNVNTVEPRVVGRFCIGFGPGLYDPQPGPNKFHIRARNQCGTNMDKGGNAENFKIRIKTGDKTSAGVVKDAGGGLYAAECDYPDKGQVEVDVTFQGQSIAGFPVSLNMDAQAKLAPLFQMRKVEEDILFLQKKLESVDSSVEMGTTSARMNPMRKCIACNQREVCALLLPCRHYRYCAACASGFVVLETPCKRCNEKPSGYILISP